MSLPHTTVFILWVIDPYQVWFLIFDTAEKDHMQKMTAEIP